jgi:thiosulfate/3-mercaptopyruvate sulfurtransferase
MSWKNRGLVLVWILVCACNFNKESTPSLDADVVTEKSADYYSTEHLIEVETLQALLDRPTIKIIDFRKMEAYKKGHIRGALPMWRDQIEDTSYAYGGMMASKAQMEALLSGLGIRTNDTIVVYDDRGSCDAARLWWILANYDFNSVKIVNGGLDAWKEIDGAISTDITEIIPANFILSKQSSMKYLSTKEEMLDWIAEKNRPLIIDTRTEDEFSGKRQKKGAQAGGRIPESIWIDWAACVDYNRTKKFKSYEALVEIYKDLEIDNEQGIIAYCHSGVRSAHTTFVLTQLLGYKNVRNYDGSWTEWSVLEGYPVKKDSVTTILE